MKKVFGFILLGIAIFLFSFGNFNIAGNVVRENFDTGFLSLNLLAFCFLLASIFIFVSKTGLDYLLIPDGSDKMLEKRDNAVMEELIKRQGKVKDIYLMNGRDSEEDILYLGKLLKGGERIGLVTFPEHYQEYKELIKKAKRDKKFPKFVKVQNVNTRKPANNFGDAWYNLKEKVYGKLGLWEEKLKKRDLDYVENRNEKGLERAKKLVHKIVRLN